MARPAMGVRSGGEAYTAAQPTVRRREQAVHRRLFERLEQEEQRLKKHDGRWMSIQRLRLLESFVDVYNN